MDIKYFGNTRTVTKNLETQKLMSRNKYFEYIIRNVEIQKLKVNFRLSLRDSPTWLCFQPEKGLLCSIETPLADPAPLDLQSNLWIRSEKGSRQSQGRPEFGAMPKIGTVLCPEKNTLREIEIENCKKMGMFTTSRPELQIKEFLNSFRKLQITTIVMRKCARGQDLSMTRIW